MRNLLVAGGAGGGGGEGIVRALLASVPDVRVIATSRSAERLVQLEARVGEYGDPTRLIGIVGNAGDPRGAETIRDRIRAEAGPLDIAGACSARAFRHNGRSCRTAFEKLEGFLAM
ncbi:MAG: hypothetical protein JWM87_3266 [Candidatus Eremiobacteraeota bacterium]|nr:hypothetical protein [Candidatus Eremiobacteraeota bacterium]